MENKYKYACKEVWRPVVGYEGRYDVSNYGRVKTLKRKFVSKDRELSYAIHSKEHPYYVVTLSKNGNCICPFVHKLVGEAFLPNPKNLPLINHKFNVQDNFVYVNEDGTVDPEKSSIEWCDYSYNLCYGDAIEKMLKTRNKKGTYGAEKPINQYTLDGNFVKWHKSINAAARSFPDYKKSRQAGINMAVTGKRESAYGYKWEYA